ncbi:MAG: aquaporin [Ktedonobacterales bacterium]
MARTSVTASQPTITERVIAEGIGTFLLTFVGGGAAALAALIAHGNHGTAPYADVLGVALAHGLILFVIVLAIGKISGAHVNPAITIGLAAVNKFPWEEVPGYLIGQFIGAIVGAAAILIPYGAQAATIGHLGAPALAVNTNIWQGLFSEAIGAFILVFAVIATAIDTRAPAGWAGLTIGMALAAAILLVGVATGAAVNPARAVGPIIIDAIFYHTSPDGWLTTIVCYIIGPLIGGVVATFLYAYIARLPRTRR